MQMRNSVKQKDLNVILENEQEDDEEDEDGLARMPKISGDKHYVKHDDAEEEESKEFSKVNKSKQSEQPSVGTKNLNHPSGSGSVLSHPSKFSKAQNSIVEVDEDDENPDEERKDDGRRPSESMNGSISGSIKWNIGGSQFQQKSEFIKK